MKKTYRILLSGFLLGLMVAMICVLCSCEKEIIQPLNQITFDNRGIPYQSTIDFQNFDVTVSMDPYSTHYMSRVFVGNDGKQYDLVGEPVMVYIYDCNILRWSYEAETAVYFRIDSTKFLPM